MSEPQTEYETDTDPERSSAPWEAEPPDETGLAHVWASDGDLVCSVTDAPVFGESAWERARLIAAAGTAAQEAKEMGYDPVAVVEAVPQMLAYMEDFQKALSSLDRNFPGTFESELNELCSFLNALARAEGSDQ